MHCPDFIFDVSCARVASEFLESELEMSAYSAKYFNGLSGIYSSITQDDLQRVAEEMLQFLSDIEAGENAVVLLTGFMFFRINFDGVGRPRKLKPMFGTVEDPVKELKWSVEGSSKGFRAYVFGLRSNTVPQAPTGWDLGGEEALPKLSELAKTKLSLIDVL